MLKIEVDVTAEDARSRDKVGRVLFDALREQVSATPWQMTVHYWDDVGFKEVGSAKYSNPERQS